MRLVGRRSFVVLGIFLASLSAEAAPRVPFVSDHGQVKRPLDMRQLLRTARSSGDVAPVLAQIHRDKHLSAVAKRSGLESALKTFVSGQFRPAKYLAKAKTAAAAYAKANAAKVKKDYWKPDLAQAQQTLYRKLELFAELLKTVQREDRRASTKADNPGKSAQTTALFGHGSYQAALEPVGIGVKPLVGGRDATKAFAFQMTGKRRKGRGAQGTARTGVGRALFLQDVYLDTKTGKSRPAKGKRKSGEITTQVVFKGAGPTEWAGKRNLFSSHKSGSFPLHHGEEDVALTRQVKRAGIPVYEPTALLALPYWDLHPNEGWRPLAIYARLPQENLRFSDLEQLPKTKAKAAAAQVVRKLEVIAGRKANSLTEADLMRFVAVRLGRISGLFEGGKTFPKGKRFFHGALHAQNVSLLGEMVDFAASPGLVGGAKGLTKAFRTSLYAQGEAGGWPDSFKRATREKVVFAEILLPYFAHFVRRAVGGSKLPGEQEMQRLFERGYKQGFAGKKANSARETLKEAQR